MKLVITSILLILGSVSFAQNFDIYVSDAGNFDSPPWQILKYDQNGENPETFINENLAWPQDILFMEESGVVLITNLNSGKITKYNSTNGNFIDDFASNIGGPTRFKIGEDDFLYVLQWSGNGKVKRYQLDGEFVDDFTDTGVPNSIGLAWDSEGNLYVSSYSGNFIRKFSSTGLDLGLFVNTNLQGPTNIWFDENGHLFVFNWNGGNIVEFDTDGNYVGVFISGLNQPEGLDFMDNGNLLIGDGGTGSVKMYDSEGTFIENIVAPGAGGLLQTNAVVIRELPNGIDEIDLKESVLKSNIGTNFTLENPSQYSIESINVYDTTGTLKTSKLYDGTTIWNADKVSTGKYIIEIVLDDRKVITESVIVSKK